jgi:hypothetical protein
MRISAGIYCMCDTDRLTRELARDLFRSVQGAPVDFLTFAEFCEVGATLM